MRWQDAAIVVAILSAFLLFLFARGMMTPDGCAEGGPKSQMCGRSGAGRP